METQSGTYIHSPDYEIPRSSSSLTTSPFYLLAKLVDGAYEKILLVIAFWLWRVTSGDSRGPGIFKIRRINRFLCASLAPLSFKKQSDICSVSVAKFTPWQIIVTTLSAVYAIRNVDSLLGLGCQFHSILLTTPPFILIDSSIYLSIYAHPSLFSLSFSCMHTTTIQLRNPSPTCTRPTFTARHG
jgi:hypothetical protein